MERPNRDRRVTRSNKNDVVLHERGKKNDSTEVSKSDLELNLLTSRFEAMSLPDQGLDDLTLEGLMSYIKAKPCTNIITMVGAGISTAAGIPDFRSPKTGLYHNLKKYNLPYTQAIFELKYFKKNPAPFFHLAHELLPGAYQPTKSHYFVKLLEEKGLLLRHYTQNIDNLDRAAGIRDEKIVEAHGTFYRSHCLGCHLEYDLDWLKENIINCQVPFCTKCGDIVKPDIVFFGENLPPRFFDCVKSDFQKCDLLIIMGTSLEVEPFASLANRTKKSCPRLMINKEDAGPKINFRSGLEYNRRDVLWMGDCDKGCQLMADKLGWSEDLLKLIEGNLS